MHRLKQYGALIGLAAILSILAAIAFLMFNMDHSVERTVIELPVYDYEGDDWFQYDPDGVKLEVKNNV